MTLLPKNVSDAGETTAKNLTYLHDAINIFNETITRQSPKSRDVFAQAGVSIRGKEPALYFAKVIFVLHSDVHGENYTRAESTTTGPDLHKGFLFDEKKNHRRWAFFTSVHNGDL